MTSLVIRIMQGGPSSAYALPPASMPVTVTTSPSSAIFSMTPPFAASRPGHQIPRTLSAVAKLPVAHAAIRIIHENDRAGWSAKRLKDEFSGDRENFVRVVDNSSGITNACEVHVVRSFAGGHRGEVCAVGSRHVRERSRQIHRARNDVIETRRKVFNPILAITIGDCCTGHRSSHDPCSRQALSRRCNCGNGSAG